MKSKAHDGKVFVGERVALENPKLSSALLALGAGLAPEVELVMSSGSEHKGPSEIGFTKLYPASMGKTELSIETVSDDSVTVSDFPFGNPKGNRAERRKAQAIRRRWK